MTMKFTLKRFLILIGFLALVISFLIPFGWANFAINTEYIAEGGIVTTVTNRSFVPVWYRMDIRTTEPIICLRERKTNKVSVSGSRTMDWVLLDINEKIEFEGGSSSYQAGVLVCDWLGREKTLFDRTPNQRGE